MDSADKEGLAVILMALLHGLRPDLTQEYLYDWMIKFVEELLDGEGFSVEDALRLGGIISGMATEPTKDDSVH